jgi:hypothetical protein
MYAVLNACYGFYTQRITQRPQNFGYGFIAVFQIIKYRRFHHKKTAVDPGSPCSGFSEKVSINRSIEQGYLPGLVPVLVNFHICQRMGRPPISTMGLGRKSVSSESRVP